MNILLDMYRKYENKLIVWLPLSITKYYKPRCILLYKPILRIQHFILKLRGDKSKRNIVQKFKLIYACLKHKICIMMSSLGA